MPYGKDALYPTIAVAVLLIGTASGNALVMLVLSATILLVALVFFNPRKHGVPIRILITAAAVAILVAAIVALIGR